jgi:hypothetical protein
MGRGTPYEGQRVKRSWFKRKEKETEKENFSGSDDTASMIKVQVRKTAKSRGTPKKDRAEERICP